MTYFELHEKTQAAKKVGDYMAAARLTKAATLFAGLVAETLRRYGRWDIRSSVAVTEGGAVLMALGEHEGLAALQSALRAVPTFLLGRRDR